VTLGVYENVLGFKVSVCDTFSFVEELEYEDDFGGVELGGGFVEAPRSAQVAKDLAAGAVVEDHVQRVERLEAGDHGGYEGMSCDFGEHIALVANVLDLLETDD